MKYKSRVKNVKGVVDAVQFNGSTTMKTDIENWINNGFYINSKTHTRDCGKTIDINGVKASMGDWVIKNSLGEFTILSNNSFIKFFEREEV